MHRAGGHGEIPSESASGHRQDTRPPGGGPAGERADGQRGGQTAGGGDDRVRRRPPAALAEQAGQVDRRRHQHRSPENDSPGYPIESRMVYYLCRTVSLQHGVTFAKSDYGGICKCYSLWFCPELDKGEAPSIDRFFIKGERVFGKGDVAADKEDYDLLEGCTVRFNDDPTSPVNEVIRYLQLLLTDIAPPLERLDELHVKYGLSKTREAEDMCNYSEYLKQKAKEERDLEFLERLEADHFNDNQIMKLLQVDAEHLKSLREMLQEKHAAFMAD